MFNWLFRKRNKLIHPGYIQQYLDLSFKISSETVDQVEYVVLDCETTGLGKSDRLITIGAVTCTSHEIYLEKILDQRYPCSEVGSSSEIHGELSSYEEEDEKELLRLFLHFLKNKIIVGHNIRFDVSKINQLVGEYFNISLKNHVIDTAHLIKRLDPVYFERTVGGNTNLHLDDLCNKYDIPIENRHTALGDAYLTAQLLQKVLFRLKKRGVNQLKQLLN